MLVRSGGTTSLPDSIVLTADLTGGLSDVSDPDTMSRLLFGEQRTLRDFVDAVFGRESAAGDSSSADTRDIEALNEILAESPILSLEEAARALQRPIAELTATVARHPAYFGLVGQPPTMLFRIVETSSCP